MLIFAHTGLTLGAVRGLAYARPRPGTKLIDYRLVLIGSMLPDIIDKPIGQFFFKSTFSNGRILGHSLLFSLTLTLIGLYLYRQGKPGMLTLSLCSLGHLILDGMWQDPVTLLWPIYGWSFPKADLTNWLPNILYALRTDPSVYIPELIGALILMHFTLMLIKKKELYTLITHGIVRQFLS